VRYLDLAETLRNRITAGAYAPSGELPSENELSARHHVSRVTVRRALELLRDESLVASRRGSGWFVAVDPVRQTLGRFTTVEAALENAGVVPTRRVLDFRFETARTDVRASLGLPTGAEVLRVRRLNLADGEPFAVVTVWVPAALGADLSRADVERSPFYELLPLRGVDLGAVAQAITAETATRDDVTRLNVPAGAAMLVCRRITRDRDGKPVIVSEHRYPGHRTALEVEFPIVHSTTAGAPGLRPVPAARRAYPSEPKHRTAGARHD
jgi:GntR family transcriptional regulator